MYDPMVAKLIVWDADREQATARMLRALGEYEIGGLKTLIPFHQAILQTDQWANAETCRDLIEDRKWLGTLAFAPAEAASGAGRGAHGGADLHGRGLGQALRRQGDRSAASGRRRGERLGTRRHGGGGRASPRAGAGGLRVAVAVAATRSPPRSRARCSRSPFEAGADVEEGALVCVIEAMKMENEITAHKSGKVSELPIAVGASVANGDTLAVITPATE